MAINKLKKKKIDKLSTPAKRESVYGTLLKQRTKLKFEYNTKIHQFLTVKEKYKDSEKVFKYYESILGTVVKRLGFAKSARGAAQLISHKNIKVNDKTISHKNYVLQPGDKISVVESLHNNPHIHDAIKKNNMKFSHLKKEGLAGEFLCEPNYKEVYMTGVNFAQACSSQLRKN